MTETRPRGRPRPFARPTRALRFAAMLAACGLLAIAACETQTNEVPRSKAEGIGNTEARPRVQVGLDDQLPPNATKVAEGNIIEYTAPRDGIVFLAVDNQVQMIRVLRGGTMFRAVGTGKPGLDIQELRFDKAELYFLPATLE